MIDERLIGERFRALAPELSERGADVGCVGGAGAGSWRDRGGVAGEWYLAEHESEPDAVVLDIGLPDLNGRMSRRACGPAGWRAGNADPRPVDDGCGR